VNFEFCQLGLDRIPAQNAQLQAHGLVCVCEVDSVVETDNESTILIRSLMIRVSKIPGELFPTICTLQ
jgi:hypothetical protein